MVEGSWGSRSCNVRATPIVLMSRKVRRRHCEKESAPGLHAASEARRSLGEGGLFRSYPGGPEPEGVVAVLGRVAAAERAPRARGGAGEAATAGHAVAGALGGPFSIPWVDLSRIGYSDISAPLPDIPVHIMKPEAIRVEPPHGSVHDVPVVNLLLKIPGGWGTVFCSKGIGLVRRALKRGHLVPGEVDRIRSGSCRVLPLRLSRKGKR